VLGLTSRGVGSVRAGLGAGCHGVECGEVSKPPLPCVEASDAIMNSTLNAYLSCRSVGSRMLVSVTVITHATWEMETRRVRGVVC
jgi:hypothetical protein